MSLIFQDITRRERALWVRVESGVTMKKVCKEGNIFWGKRRVKSAREKERKRDGVGRWRSKPDITATCVLFYFFFSPRGADASVMLPNHQIIIPCGATPDSRGVHTLLGSTHAHVFRQNLPTAGSPPPLYAFQNLDQQVVKDKRAERVRELSKMLSCKIKTQNFEIKKRRNQTFFFYW